MSTYTTSKHYFGSGSPYYYGKMTLTTSSSNTNTTVSWKIELIQKYGKEYGVGVKISGSASGTVTGYAKSVKSEEYTLLSKSGSVSFAKGTSSATKSFTITAYGTTVSGIGSAGGSVTKSGSITVPALEKYTISYDAKGGSGAPSTQYKYYGKTLTLSSTKPTRTGYTFQGWATSSAATSVAYAAGASYTSNSSKTLYAVWKANTWTVSYNANGGSGAPGAQTKTYNQTLTLSTTKPTKANYNFKGWGTSSTATSASYQPGSQYTSNAAITLYAIWELAYVAPRITGIKAYRVNSGGGDDDEGTFAHIEFSWAIDSKATLSSISVAAKPKTSSSYTVIATPSGSGTSGAVTIGAVDFNGAPFNTEQSYDVKITVTDSMGNKSETTSISPAFFTMDFKVGGKGIAFGAPSTADGFYCAMPATLANNLKFSTVDTGVIDANGYSTLKTTANKYVQLGGGLYDASDGETRIFGNQVRVYSKNNIYLNKSPVVGGHTTAIGSILSGNSTYSCATTTSMKDVGLNYSLPAGAWVIQASVRCPSVSGSWRLGAQIYINGGGQGSSYVVSPNAPSGETAVCPILVTAAESVTTFSLGVRQNSGSTQTITYYWRALRIA